MKIQNTRRRRARKNFALRKNLKNFSVEENTDGGIRYPPDKKFFNMDLFKIIREEFGRLLAVFLAFLFMVLVAGIFMSRIVRNQLVDNMEGLLDTGEEAIYANLRGAESAVISSVLTIEHLLDAPDSHDKIHQYIRKFSKALSDPLIGAGSFEIVYGVFNGEFISGTDWEPPDDYHIFDRPWYIAAHEVQGGGVSYSTPYLDADTQDIVVSVSHVVKNPQGENAGVVSIDVSIHDMSLYVKSLNSAYGGYGVLISQDFTYLAHPNESFIGRRMKYLGPKYEEMENAFLSGATEISGVDVLEKSGIPAVIFFRKLESGWYIGIGIPADVYYKTTHIMMIFLSVLGIIFMLLLNTLMVRMSMARKKADEENKSKSSFLARMSHEIRTPMNAIISLVEILLRKNLPSDVRDQMMIIRRSSVTLLTLINDILDFSKLEAGQIQLDIKTYSFSSLISDVKTIIMVRLESKQLEFIVHIGEGIPERLIGDDIRIRQILINLLTNAVKYTDKGRIELDAHARALEDERVEIELTVRDTGIGFKPEDMNILFHEFSRFDSVRNRGIEGSGLGLAIVNSLCKIMGGTIDVQSVYEQGSTFTVKIPQGVDKTDMYGTPDADTADSRQVLDFSQTPPFIAPDIRVLVVDDIETNLMVAEELLQFYEFRVDTATNGTDVLRLVQENRYDLIFMDHMMPGMDGVETTEKIRALGANRADSSSDFLTAAYFSCVPIIALTANALNEYRDMFLNSGFNDFLAKPIEVEKLYAILKKWVPTDKQLPASASDKTRNQDKTAEDAASSNTDAIEGVNMKAGVINTGGSFAVYLRVLSMFQHDAEKRLRIIRQAMESNNMALYTTMVHALKSAARSIGASEWGNFAEDLETAARNNNISLIKQRTEELLEQLRSLTDNIAGFLSKTASDIDTHSAALLSKEQLDALQQALADINMPQIDALMEEYGELPLNSSIRRFLGSIEEDILLFEYDKAIAKIREMSENSLK